MRVPQQGKQARSVCEKNPEAVWFKSHLRNQQKRRPPVRVVFSFADYGGLRFEPCGAQSLWKLQAKYRRRKGCRFCEAKWSAVPTRQPLSVRSAASKVGQHPTSATKRRRHPLWVPFLRLVLMVRSGRYRLPGYADERARWGSAVVRCRWQMKRECTSGSGRRGQASVGEGRPMRVPQQGYVRTRFPCQHPTSATKRRRHPLWVPFLRLLARRGLPRATFSGYFKNSSITGTITLGLTGGIERTSFVSSFVCPSLKCPVSPSRILISLPSCKN